MNWSRGIWLMFGCIGVGWQAFAAEPNNPVDAKLKGAYQRVRFAQQYPEEAVQFIQGQLQDAAKPSPILAQLAKDARPEVRALVALLIGEYGDSAGAPVLWSLTRDPLDSVRLTAAGSLVRLAHLTPVSVVTDGLEDEEAAIRRLTASTLAALADKRAEDALIDALKDGNELVRTDVVKALGKASCGTSRAVPSLVEMLHDSSVNVRDRTAQVLGGFVEPTVIEPLLTALKDSDWHVRAAAADSLGGWTKKSNKVVEALLRVVEHDDFALVRDRAALPEVHPAPDRPPVHRGCVLETSAAAPRIRSAGTGPSSSSGKSMS